MQDQQEILKLAIDRTDHFHSRVGFPGGPQTNHPAASEWKEVLDFHCEWWDAIVTCEFGPYAAIAI